jgi:glutamyl-tRNA synthetase
MGLRVRFAPSPTGYLHIGGARTALFNWLLARNLGGVFVLRIEDTDRERSTPEAVQAILDGMSWLGLDWDEGPFFQTARMDRYREVIAELVQRGRAYPCTCTPDEVEAMRAKARAEKRKPRYDGTCRNGPSHPGAPACIRLRTHEHGATFWDDAIKGRIAFDNDELDDLIIARTDGSPTYNFCVVVDDFDMRITHVLRGDDHVNNTPRQIQIYDAMEWTKPLFGHVPMILGADKQRLSKRHGATSVLEYRDQGYLPWALVNYLVRLSWSHGDQEIFTRDELIAAFKLGSVGAAASVFNPDKLRWVNEHWLKQLSPEALAQTLAPYLQKVVGRDVSADARLPSIAKSFQERAKTLVEMAELAAFFFRRDDEIVFDPKAREKFLTGETKPVLEALLARLEALPELTPAAVEPIVTGLAAERGLKLVGVAQPTRVALTGGTVSPGIYDVLALLGRETTLSRLRRAVATLG